MVAKANRTREIESISPPQKGSLEKAAKHNLSAAIFVYSKGERSMLLTITIPVTAQITTVSQKGPVMEISPCLTGDSQLEAAEVIGIEPSPASLVNNPFEIPVRIPRMTAVPVIPPIKDFDEKADFMMTRMDSGTKCRFMKSRYPHPAR